MKHKLLTPLTWLLVLSLPLILTVPVAEASIYKSVSFCVIGYDAFTGSGPALNVWLTITYDLWDGIRTIYVRQVTVKFDYLYQPGGYARLDFFNLETGRSPWNSPGYCTIHWKSPILYMMDYYEDGPKQYTAQPKVSYRWAVGKKGAYGVYAPGTIVSRLCADGNYLLLEFTLIIHMPISLQIAWQFAYGNDLGAVVFNWAPWF